MTATRDRPAALLTPPGTPRVRLAQIAYAAALQVPGVAATTSGPSGLFVTAAEGDRVEGVRCVATGDGSYDVSLQLRCELVPLRAVGQAVRASVARAAAAASIGVAKIDVLIADLVELGQAQ